MNREKAETIADRTMTRIEQDGAIHKDAIADEIQAADVIDVITYDEQKGQWVHRDGKPLDMGDDRVDYVSQAPMSKWPNNNDLLKIFSRGMSIRHISLEDFKA